MLRLPWRRSRVPAERFEEARAVVQAAQEGLDRARARGAESQAIAERFARLREHNHFREGLVAMLETEVRGHAPDAR
jgi:hypothetical protein